MLLFVIDASAPLSRPELRFLEEVTDRIQTVLFALTKRDEYRGWEQVSSDDRALLAGTRYAQAPVYPVSSTMRLGASALADGDAELARLIQDESGIDALEGALAERAAGKTTILRAENLVRITQHALQRLDELDQAVLQAAGDDGGKALAELQTAKEAAAAFRVVRGKASRALERSFRALGQQVELDLSRALADVRSRCETRLEQGKIAGLPEALESEMQGVVAAVNAVVAQRLEVILGQLQEELELNERLDGARTVDVNEERTLMPPTLRSRSGSGGGLIDLFGSVTPVSMVASVSFSVLGFAGLALGAPIGLLLGGAIWTQRKSMRNQQQARAVLMEALDWARRELPPAIRAEITDLKDAVEAELLAALARRERELADTTAEYERVAGESSTTRKEAREAALQRRKEIVQLRAAVAALRSQLAQLSQKAVVTA